MPKITRLQREMEQFDDESYKTEFKEVIHVTDHMVQVTMNDDSVWSLIRFDDFMFPPEIYKDGERVEGIFCSDELWTPALTSVKALLMAYALKPE